MNTEMLQKLESDKGRVLVEFYATWCPHCRKMIPIMAAIRKQLAGEANVYQFDIDEYGDLADKLSVKSIPAFIVYENGEELWRHVGELPAEELIAVMRKQAS